MFRKLLLGTLLFASSAGLAAPPAQFLGDAIQGDNSEIRLGQLIAERGSSPSVRKFGSMLVSDHTQARDQAAAVARQMGVPVAESMPPEARSEYAKLEHLRGQEFDREVKRSMVEGHQKNIAKFKAQAQGHDRTAALAREQLPVLEKHLRMAQALQG